MENKYYIGTVTDSESLQHFGIKGMKWGVRRYQNPDGTLTEEGKQRYGQAVSDIKTVAKGAAVSGGTALAGLTGVMAYISGQDFKKEMSRIGYDSIKDIKDYIKKEVDWEREFNDVTLDDFKDAMTLYEEKINNGEYAEALAIQEALKYTKRLSNPEIEKAIKPVKEMLDKKLKEIVRPLNAEEMFGIYDMKKETKAAFNDVYSSLKNAKIDAIKEVFDDIKYSARNTLVADPVVWTDILKFSAGVAAVGGGITALVVGAQKINNYFKNKKNSKK